MYHQLEDENTEMDLYRFMDIIIGLLLIVLNLSCSKQFSTPGVVTIG